MKIINYSILFILLVTGAQLSFSQAQTDSTNIEKQEQISVKVIGRAMGDSIMLRWAVTTPYAWKKANEYGYIVERYTILRNGETLREPEKKLLSESPVKPMPMEKWEPVFDSSDEAAIMAQALYGESFVVETTDEMAQIINQSEELQQRFTFSLIAAENNYQVAKWAGLGMIDTDVKSNEKYLYKVRTAIPEEILLVESSGAYLSPGEKEELPKPIDLVGVFTDKRVLLAWNYTMLQNTYNAYHIEKSDDGGKTFFRINEKPYANLLSQKSTTDRYFYSDTLEINDFEYYYRVRGITAFGELGPPSDMISGAGDKMATLPPQIIRHGLIKNEKLYIQWKFSEEEERGIIGFELWEAPKESGPFATVMAIKPNLREAIYEQENNTSYFKIAAIGIHERKLASLPILSQRIDSVPPAPPTGLEGEIDSTGIVHIRWKPNTEKDLLGYRVFRANLPKEEPAQITSSPIEENFFTDSVVIKSLNAKVYYRIVASDNRYNNSELSEVLVLEKPDVVPPSPPVITYYKINKGKVQLDFARSFNDDVVKHLLYRKEKNKETDWLLLAVITDTTTLKYTDEEPPIEIPLSYKLQAIDKAGLSAESPVVSLIVPDEKVKPEIKTFDAYIDRKNKFIELWWNYKEDNIAHFVLYKAAADEKLTMLKVVDADKKRYVDENSLKINTIYKYMIRAAFKNGTFSPFKELIVEY